MFISVCKLDSGTSGSNGNAHNLEKEKKKAFRESSVWFIIAKKKLISYFIFLFIFFQDPYHPVWLVPLLGWVLANISTVRVAHQWEEGLHSPHLSTAEATRIIR